MANEKPEELELKYIIDRSQPKMKEAILNTLLANGYSVVKTKQKENDDEYYDTKDFSLLSRGGSLRIRKLTQDGQTKYKATYKMPTGEGEEFVSREEIEFKLDNNSIDELKEKMEEKNIDVNLDDVLPTPLLNSVTQRRDVVLGKDGVQACFSFDDVKYISHIMEGKTVEDSMVEIEGMGSEEDRTMLKDINNILKENFPGLQTNKQSKYERGMRKTMEKSKKKNGPDDFSL